jgi:transcriptional regulator with XRE-family HTH domain
MHRAGYRTQDQLASAIGVSQETVSNWMTGKNRPTGEHLERLVELLGIDPLLFDAAPAPELIDALHRIATAIEDCARALRGQ